MDLKNIILIVIGLINLFLGLRVFLNNKKSIINLSFSFFAYGVVFWCFSMVGFRAAETVSASILWARFLYLAAVLIPYFLVWFVYLFPEGKFNLSKTLKVFTALPFILIAVVSMFPGSIIQSVEIIQGMEKQIVFGPAYNFYSLYITSYFAWAFIVLIKKYFRSKGIVKTQIRYIFWGIFISAIFGSFNNLVLPSFGIFRFNWLGQVFTIVYVSFIAYAITRYRLMDIRLVINRTIIYLSTFASVVGVGYLLLFLNNLLGKPFPFSIFFPAVLVIIGLSFRWLFKLFETIANKYFYYTFYSYKNVLTDLGKQLTQILDLKKLGAIIVETLQKTMKLDRIVILIRRESGRYAILNNVGFKEDNGISLVEDNFLTEFLQKSRSLLVFDELSLLKIGVSQIEERDKIEELKKNMERIEANVCLPLFRGKDIMGIIVLGRKISRDAYSKEDLELLDVLASQASIAIENAQLYGQVNDLSFNLQQKVDEQTKELITAYNELKRINRLKTEFLGMSSHQLRTPLTVIKGYLSMTLEGDYGKVPPKIKAVLENVFSASQRLVKIVGDLLDVSRIDLGKMKLEKSTVQIVDLIQSCYEEMKMESEKKGLKMIYKKSTSVLPEIQVDESKIRQVILNLIDNAIRYTQEGKIVISVEKKGKNILIKVNDTGVGMSKDEQKDIFEGFTRGTAGINHFTEGAGLGLYVSKKYLDLHKGKIWCKSTGKDKGSTFFVEIPIG